MLKLQQVDTQWRTADFAGIQEQIEKLARPRKRITELMMKSMTESNPNADNRKFLPVFFRNPLQINGTSAVESVDFSVTKLVDDKAIPTDDVETIPAQLVCRSIGYMSVSVDDSINFDDQRGRVKNVDGRVLKRDSNEPDPGLYVGGWLATGPSGVILTTMNNSFAVAQTIIHDIQSGAVETDPIKSGIDLSKHSRIVTWSDWQKIDEREVEDGKRSEKPREKILRVDEMLKVVGS